MWVWNRRSTVSSRKAKARGRQWNTWDRGGHRKVTGGHQVRGYEVSRQGHHCSPPYLQMGRPKAHLRVVSGLEIAAACPELGSKLLGTLPKQVTHQPFIGRQRGFTGIERGTIMARHSSPPGQMPGDLSWHGEYTVSRGVLGAKECPVS